MGSEKCFVCGFEMGHDMYPNICPSCSHDSLENNEGTDCSEARLPTPSDRRRSDTLFSAPVDNDEKPITYYEAIKTGCYSKEQTVELLHILSDRIEHELAAHGVKSKNVSAIRFIADMMEV